MRQEKHGKEIGSQPNREALHSWRPTERAAQVKTGGRALNCVWSFALVPPGRPRLIGGVAAPGPKKGTFS